MKAIFLAVATVLTLHMACDQSASKTISAVESPQVGRMRQILISQISPNRENYINAELAIEYGHALDGMQGMGLQGNPWTVKDPTNPQIISIETGSAVFNGRRITSGIIQAHIEMLNRQEGTKKTNFIAIAATDDSEFNMWRNIQVCTDENKSSSVISTWKATHSFQ